MRVLSASEAIAPAIHRTKTVLFQPFKIGRSWKLAATAYLSAMGAFFIPTPFFFFGSSAHRTLPALLFSFGFGIVFSAITFVFFYLGARLEFVLFDIVLLNEKFIALSWKRHKHHSWRWVGFKVLFSIVMGVISAPAYYFGYMYLMPRLAAVSASGQPPSPELFSILLRFYAVIGLPIGFAFLCSSLLTNFVLPSIALENTSVREGLRRFLGLIGSEPGPVCLFVVFKVLLGICGFIAMEAVILIAELICLIPFALIAVAGWFLLRSAGDAGHLIMLTGAILLALIFAAFLFYCGMLVMGCVHIFFQAYALYFLGGRYPALGDMLEPVVHNSPYPNFAVPPPPLSSSQPDALA
jgi:hypothetical protein